MTRLALSVLTTMALVLATASIAVAHTGHDHKILGTVTMAATDHVMVKDKDAKNATVYLDRDTKVVREKKAASVSDIKTGMRVAITAVTVTEKGAEKMIAKTIELGSAPAAR